MKIQNCERIMTVEQMQDRDAWLKIRWERRRDHHGE